MSSSESRRVHFANDCSEPYPPPAIPNQSTAIPDSLNNCQLDQMLPPQDQRNEPFKLGSSYLTVERLSQNGARPPLTRQYVNDPTADPTNHYWQRISSLPSQKVGREAIQEVIRRGERLRPEKNESREPWQRLASQTRLRPPAKLSGTVNERSLRGYQDDAIYALNPERSMVFPDCTGYPADLPLYWKSVLRQPHEPPKRIFEKRLIDRYPEVYGDTGAISPIVNPQCPPPPLSTSLKPFPDHRPEFSPQVRPWTTMH